MRRAILIAALLAAVLGAASCGGDDDTAGQGDPKCFAEDAKNNTCTSSEGVTYRVVDRDSTGTLGPGLSAFLADGPRPTTATRVDATALVKPAGPYTGDVAIQYAKGKLFIPKTRVRKGDQLKLSWTMPHEEVVKLYSYPSYMTFSQAPDKCPGGKAQCFVYIRLWK